MPASELHNPHFDGKPFFLEGGPTGVLLSHGFTATCWEVRRLAEALHAHGYTVAGPLLPGHGSQATDLNRVRWQEWAEAGETVYQRLRGQCQQVLVGGESMGSLVALHLASRHPELAGVLCYAPAIQLNMPTSTRLVLRLAAPFVAQVGRASLDCADVWQGYPGLPLKGALQFFQFQRAVREELPKIHQPLLICQGRLDTTVHPQAGELILRAVKSESKEHHWLEKSSHVITLDQELERVTEITVAFIERVGTG
jgi:carboxylesterase